MRKLLLAVVMVALVLALYSPAWAQQDQYVPGGGPYNDYEPPPPEGSAACQYESRCDTGSKADAPHISPPGEGGVPPASEAGEGGGAALFEAAGGDPDDAAALKGAIEAARADRAGGVAPVAVTPVAASEPAGERTDGNAKAGGEAKANVEEQASGGEEAGVAEEGEDAAIKESGSANGQSPLALLGTGSVLLLVGAGLLLRRILQ